jgi:hypothetical protein
MSTLNQKGIFASLLRSSSSELGSLSSTDVISGNTMSTACNEVNTLDLEQVCGGGRIMQEEARPSTARKPLPSQIRLKRWAEGELILLLYSTQYPRSLSGPVYWSAASQI